ncbi:hypothetical protein HAV_00130 [Candidatus Hepatincola sp. Av]
MRRFVSQLHLHIKILVDTIGAIVKKEDEYTINIMLPILEKGNDDFSIFINNVDDIKNLLADFTKFTGITDVKFIFSKFDVGTDWVSIILIGVGTNLASNMVKVSVLKIIFFLWNIAKDIGYKKKEKEEHIKELEIPKGEEYIKKYIDKEINISMDKYIQHNYEEEKKIYNGKTQSEVEKALITVCEKMVDMHMKGFEIEPSLNPPVFLIAKEGIYTIDEEKYKEYIKDKKPLNKTVKQITNKSKPEK